QVHCHELADVADAHHDVDLLLDDVAKRFKVRSDFNPFLGDGVLAVVSFGNQSFVKQPAKQRVNEARRRLPPTSALDSRPVDYLLASHGLLSEQAEYVLS